MPIKNELGVNVALIQLGLAVDALTAVPPQLLNQADIRDQDGKPITAADALREIEHGLAAVRARLRDWQARRPSLDTVFDR